MEPEDNIQRRLEVEHYDEIGKALKEVFEANLPGGPYQTLVLVGEISGAIQTLIANGYDACKALAEYGKNVHRLHLDISVLVENKENGKFEIVIFEIKKTKQMGLTHLSQLIGYCLVSKAKFGVLVNVDSSISGEFSVILDADKDLTRIVRVLEDDERIEHKLGVMKWNSATLQMEYTEAGAIVSLTKLIDLVVESLS